MKRVSCKEFFSVLWSGLCQALGWFFGLFGYKREGKFAKCVWGVFSISAAVIMVAFASVVVYAIYNAISETYWESRCCRTKYGQYISRTIDYISDGDDDGYLINKKTGEKVLKGIQWIAKPLGNDSLVCYSNGKLRGYFNAKNGRVVVEPKYKHAWVSSDGLAAIEDKGMVKFIDGNGKMVLDCGIVYDEASDDYVFHGGFLIVRSENKEKYGLLDKTGKFVLPMEYDFIEIANNLEFWRLRKDSKWAVYDKEMKAILPFIDGTVELAPKSIDVTMSDHTMRKYDYQGNLINDFCISCVCQLEYNTEEMYCLEKTTVEEGEGITAELEPWQHKRAVAKLRAYAAGDGFEGLMTAEGRVVTMPIYESIEAINADTYLCTIGNGNKVVVDGNGVVVR